MTQEMPNAFTPTTPPPGVSPLSSQRPPRKRAAKKESAPKAKKTRQPRVPKTLHAVTDAEIKAGAAKKRKAAKPRKAVARKARNATSADMIKIFTECKPEDAKTLAAVVDLITPLGKGGRERVLTALGKLFA